MNEHVQELRTFIRDILVIGAAIREDFHGKEKQLVPGFKDRIEAVADQKVLVLVNLINNRKEA